MRRDLAEAVREPVERFLTAHAAYLADGSSRRLMLDAGEAAIHAFRAWVTQNPARLASIHLAPDTAAQILEAMVRHWMSNRHTVTSLEAPPELIARHPGARALLAPGSEPEG
ncbi:MAG: hypothetical protein NVS9B1_13160 [Candidatus Dormibacteraceae bacterium]